MQIGHTYIPTSHPHHNIIQSAYESLTARVYRTRGAEARRNRFEKSVATIFGHHPATDPRSDYRSKVTNKALGLARMADRYFDEHGSSRGDYRATHAVEYVPPAVSRSAPYLDMGGAGLGLVRIERRRVYASSSKWHPRTTSDYFLVGRNEVGTFFAHSVRPCDSVYDAIQWIWSGHADELVRRQGDVAVASGRGRRIPSLPSGHRLDDGYITHRTHPTIRAPGKGEFLIVGRRAVTRASDNTRD